MHFIPSGMVISFALIFGKIQHVKPSLAASLIRCCTILTPRISPASPTSPKITVCASITRSRKLPAIAMTTAKSSAGSLIFIPPVTFTYASHEDSAIPIRFSKTAINKFTRFPSIPALVRLGNPKLVRQTSACTSSIIGRVPSIRQAVTVPLLSRLLPSSR